MHQLLMRRVMRRVMRHPSKPIANAHNFARARITAPAGRPWLADVQGPSLTHCPADQAGTRPGAGRLAVCPGRRIPDEDARHAGPHPGRLFRRQPRPVGTATTPLTGTQSYEIRFPAGRPTAPWSRRLLVDYALQRRRVPCCQPDQPLLGRGRHTRPGTRGRRLAHHPRLGQSSR
jgi:hypothetical protein